MKVDERHPPWHLVVASHQRFQEDMHPSCFGRLQHWHWFLAILFLHMSTCRWPPWILDTRKSHRHCMAWEKSTETHTHTCSPVVIEITEITWVLLQAVQIVSLVLNYCAWISQVLFLQPSCFFLCCRDTMILGCLKCLPSLSLCIIMYYPIVSCRNFTQFTAQNAHSIPIIES